jgi:hypothetical protein
VFLLSRVMYKAIRHTYAHRLCQGFHQ